MIQVSEENGAANIEISGELTDLVAGICVTIGGVYSAVIRKGASKFEQAAFKAAIKETMCDESFWEGVETISKEGVE